MRELIKMSTKELERIKVLNRLINGELKQSIAAEELGISDRQVRKLLKRYKEEGDLGVLSKKRGKPSNHQLAANIKTTVAEIIRSKYQGFGPTLAHEKLALDHKLVLSVSSVRNIMIDNSIWLSGRRRKAVVHQMRERRACEGEMVQVDGSPHKWFEERGPKSTLLVYVDDATGNLLHLYLTEAESTQSYFQATRQYIENHGRPVALYTDKHCTFKVNAKEACSGDGLTQFGRAMKDLNIKIIYANSPQAKGRVERMNKTLQDRLVKELRLRNISCIADANAFLPSFIATFNNRFGRAPKSPINAHRNIEDSHNLDEIFSLRFTRTLSKNLILQHDNVLYQILTNRPEYAMRGAKVQILETLEHGVTIKYKGKALNYTIHYQQKAPPVIADSKIVNLELDRWINKEKNKPSKNHPWKRAFF